MRAIVAAHDQQAGREGMKEFDINNPPRQPYTHQEYPRVMYHHGTRQMRKANSAGEVAAAEAAGWKKDPFPAEFAEPAPESAATAQEAQAEVEAAPREVPQAKRFHGKQKPAEE